MSTFLMSNLSVGPRPTRGAPCQQMLGDWTCHVVLILLVVPYSGLNLFNEKLFGDGWDLWTLSIRLCNGLMLSATSGLGNQFTWHSRIGELIGFASGCDGAVHSMHCAWTSLRRIRSGQTSHQSLPKQIGSL